MARILDVAEFAIFALALALKGSAQFLADLGSGAASARVFAQIEHQGGRHAAFRFYRGLLAARSTVALLLVCVVLLAGEPIANALDLTAEERSLAPLLSVMAAAEILGSLGTYVLVGTLGQRWLNIVLLVSNVLQPLLVILAVLVGLGLTGVVGALALASSIKAVTLHAGAIRALRSIPTGGASHPGALASFGRTAAAAGLGKLAAWVHSRPPLSFFMLPAAGRAEFATFALGYDLVHQVMALAASPAGNVIPAVMARTARDRERVQRIGSSLVIGLMTLGSAIAVPLIVGLPVLDSVIYGPQYAELGRYVVLLAPVLVLELSFAVPSTAILTSDDALLGRYGRIRLAELLLVPLYVVVGFENLLLATAVMASVRSVTAIVLLLTVQRRFGTLVRRAWAWRFAAAAGGSALAGWLVLQLPLAETIRGIGGSVVAGVTFAFAIPVFGLFRPPEVDLLTRLVPPAAPVFRRLGGRRAVR